MRIRSIKPEFYASESIGRLSRDARSLFIGLWSLADDQGRFRANPRLIASSLYPYDEDAIDLMPAWLAELTAEGCIQLYTVGDNSYGAVPKWTDHQKIDKPSASKLPPPPKVPKRNDSPTPREDSRGLDEASTTPREPSWEEQGTGSREQGEDQGRGNAREDSRALDPPEKEKLKEELLASYRTHAGGAVYGWADADDEALDQLLQLAREPEEVVARWIAALTSKKKYPRIYALRELVQHWNQFPVAKEAA